MKLQLTYTVTYDTDDFAEEIVEAQHGNPVTDEAIIAFCRDRFISEDFTTVDPTGILIVNVERSFTPEEVVDAPVAYTNNGILLCLSCAERFDLTNPAERSPEDEFLPVSQAMMNLNIEVQGKPLKCGSPVCSTVFQAEEN